jgi:hypothetical protein
MDKERTQKRITDWEPVVVGRIGRRRLGREVSVGVDVEKMKIQIWSKIAKD